MKFVHFGDLHVWSPRLHLREGFYPKRWLGPLNLALRRAKKFPPEYRLPALKAVQEEKADAVLFSGDFTTFSLREEFVMASALFEPLLEKTGSGLVAIPGNHDRYTPGSVREGFLEQFLTFVPKERVFTRPLAPRLTVVGVDHSVPLMIRSNGVVDDETHQALRETLERMKRTNQTVVLMGHFPYATPPEHPETWEHKLLGAERLAELVREFKPVLYVHGHKHVRWAIRPPETPDTLCLNGGSVAMKHGSPEQQAGYLSWEMNENGEMSNLTAKVYDGQGEWKATEMEIPLNPCP